MSFTSAISLIITVIIIYYILIQVYTVLLRITGMTKEKARFQSISLFTNAGFTTSESEIITGDKFRRNIAKSAMLSGYFFSVVIVSLVINLFLTIDFSNFDSFLPVLIFSFGGLLILFVYLNIPVVKKWHDSVIEKMTVKVIKHAAKENYISVLDSYGSNNAICKVFLYRLPSIMVGKKLADTDLKKLYGVNILMFERKGQVRYVSADTIFSNDDTLLVFGQLDSIMRLFILHESYVRNNSNHDNGEYRIQNDISIIDNYDYQVLAEIKLNIVPEILKNKTLLSSHIKDFFSINVMMVSRDGVPIRLNKDSMIIEGDKVIAFGPYENIQTVFGEYSVKSNTAKVVK